MCCGPLENFLALKDFTIPFKGPKYLELLSSSLSGIRFPDTLLADVEGNTCHGLLTESSRTRWSIEVNKRE